MSAAVIEILRQAEARLSRGERAEAARLCDQALQQAPDLPSALNLRGVIALRSREFGQAAMYFSTATATAPRVGLYWGNLALARRELGDLPGSLAAVDHGLALDSQDAALHQERGRLLLAFGRLQDAATAFVTSHGLQPTAGAAHNVGHTLVAQGRYVEAVEWFRQAISLSPQQIRSYVGATFCLLELGSYEAVLALCRTAAAHGLRSKELLANEGVAEAGLLRFEPAVRRLTEALELAPEDPGLIGHLATTVAHLCDWDRNEVLQQRALELTRESIRTGGTFCLQPFTALTMDLAPEEQRRITEHFVRIKAPLVPQPPPRPRAAARTGPRTIAYLSGDFRNHPVAHLMRTLFAHHDRSRFRIIGLSTGPDDGSDYRTTIRGTCDAFVDLAGVSSGEALRKIQALEVDLLVDMSGHTTLSRLDLLAHRPAPVQLHFLGYPGTLGAPFIDYFVTDHYLTPPGSEAHFAEKLIYMPDTYQVSDDQQVISLDPVTRADEGLPEDAFVFCSFNATYKIDRRIFTCWMQILARTPGSVLWLLATQEAAIRALRRAAVEPGIDPARLVFSGRAAKSRHLARHALADLFLDTHVVCGHTTANDALLAGLPVLACPGRPFISRVSATLLRAHGLAELICPDLDAYVARATALWEDRPRLAQVRRHLQATTRTLPARNTARFVEFLERAYLHILHRHDTGQSPESVDVASLPALREQGLPSKSG